MRQFSSNLLALACAGLALAVSACAVPPRGPPIVLRRATATVSHPRPRHPESCETTVRAKLTDTQKASLFQEFDAWQRDRRPAEAPVAAALPPPGPISKTTTTVSAACRRSSP